MPAAESRGHFSQALSKQTRVQFSNAPLAFSAPGADRLDGNRHPFVVGSDLWVSCEIQPLSEGVEAKYDSPLLILPFKPAVGELVYWPSRSSQPNREVFFGGQVALVAASVRHVLTWKREAPVVLFYLSRRFIRRINAGRVRGVLTKPFSPAACRDDMVWKLASLFESLSRQRGAQNRELILSIGGELAQRLLTWFQTEEAKPERRDTLSGTKTKIVCDYLSARLDRPVPVKEIAQVVAQSPSHFALCFRNRMKISPSRYHLRLRLERGAELLGTTDEMIRTIAKRLGFRDQGHFGRMFKKHIGYAPRVLRQSVFPKTE